MRKLTTEQFIERARTKHGDRYDYSLVDYKNRDTKVIIICPVHGTFEQLPSTHMNGCDCFECKGTKQLTTKEFIERAREKHGSKYDYGDVIYRNMRTKTTIICPIHGEFEQSPYEHINNSGCPKCSGQGFDKQYNRNNIPLYETFQPKLEPYGVKCRRSPQDTNVLEVKCIYCDKWFQPDLVSVNNKIQCIKGNYSGEHNLYCSDGCKTECPTYNQNKYPKGFKKDTSREVQPALRKLVLERDNWTCQHCDSKEDGLHCHHMEGIEINPVESADIDMCITLCKDCHNKLHKRNDCNMRRKECK